MTANTDAGLLLGWINLTNLQAAAPANALTWIKQKQLSLSPALYTNGFTNILSVQGALWTNPPAKTSAISLTNGQLVISNTGLFLAFTNIVVSNNTLTNLGVLPTNSLTGSINPKTGLLTLAFADGNGRATNSASRSDPPEHHQRRRFFPHPHQRRFHQLAAVTGKDGSPVKIGNFITMGVWSPGHVQLQLHGRQHPSHHPGIGWLRRPLAGEIKEANEVLASRIVEALQGEAIPVRRAEEIGKALRRAKGFAATAAPLPFHRCLPRPVPRRACRVREQGRCNYNQLRPSHTNTLRLRRKKGGGIRRFQNTIRSSRQPSR